MEFAIVTAKLASALIGLLSSLLSIVTKARGVAHGKKKDRR